jgi:hypothetical protein
MMNQMFLDIIVAILFRSLGNVQGGKILLRWFQFNRSIGNFHSDPLTRVEYDFRRACRLWSLNFDVMKIFTSSFWMSQNIVSNNEKFQSENSSFQSKILWIFQIKPQRWIHCASIKK